MEIITVEDLMVPIEEYATIGEDGTLYEAFKALEKAHNIGTRLKRFGENRSDGHITGLGAKISRYESHVLSRLKYEFY